MLENWAFIAPYEQLRGHLPWNYGMSVLRLPTAQGWVPRMKTGQAYRLKVTYASLGAGLAKAQEKANAQRKRARRPAMPKQGGSR